MASFLIMLALNGLIMASCNYLNESIGWFHCTVWKHYCAMKPSDRFSDSVGSYRPILDSKLTADNSSVIALLAGTYFSRPNYYPVRFHPPEKRTRTCFTECLIFVNTREMATAEADIQIHVLAEGYSRLVGDEMYANCTCSLIVGPDFKIIVDTMTPWDGEVITKALERYNISPKDITHVINTHSHSDHIGCNYLFEEAWLISGNSSMSHKDRYKFIKFTDGKHTDISKFVTIMETPGHTRDSISVIVSCSNGRKTGITGDLFEKESDIMDWGVWINAGSDQIDVQKMNRYLVCTEVDVIIPGHGPLFELNDQYREKLLKDLEERF